MSETDTVVDLEERRAATKMPQPCGYKILVAIPQMEDKSEGGVILPEEYRQREETASVVGLVVKLGPDAYSDEKRFPSGPFCKEGDFIIMKSYSGSRVDIHGHELRIINDDTPEAIVEDPRGVKRK